MVYRNKKRPEGRLSISAQKPTLDDVDRYASAN
jgi:hypothetical protein